MNSQQIDELAENARTAIRKISKVITNLDDKYLGPMFDLTKQLGKAITEIEKPVKDRVKALLETNGKAFTEAGSKEYTIGGWRMEIRPGGGGWNMDKLTSLMKSVGAKRLDYMDVEKTYTLNTEKLMHFAGRMKVTEKQLAACKNEMSWAVQTPTKVETNDE